MELNPRLLQIGALVAGGLMGLGQAPFDLLPLSLAGFVLLAFICLRASDARGAARFAWLGGFGYFLCTLHWVVEPFFVDAARHAFMAPFALGFLSAGLALFWALAGWISAKLHGGGIVWAACFAAAEWARGTVLTGFPWALPAYLWMDTPALAWAGVIGAFGLTFVTFLGPALLADFIRKRRFSWGGCCAVAWSAALLLPAPYLWSAVDETSRMARFRLVQPNVPQHQKWDPQMIPVFLRRHIALSQQGAPVDAVIWAETAYPYIMEETPFLLREIMENIPTPRLLTGTLRAEEGYFNAAAVIDENGDVLKIYDKHHLVPFGEYLPWQSVFTRLGLAGIAANFIGSFKAGPGPIIWNLGPLGKALPLICYEAVFPYAIRQKARDADYIIHFTNDAWFGKFSGPYQHLAQARFRAAESGLPILRVANTGISALIDPQGRILDQLALGISGALDVDLPPKHRVTLYTKTGDWPVLVLFGLILIIALLRRKMRD